MSFNFVTTLAALEPPIDAGALIDHAFPGDPVRQAARSIVTQLLTEGETVPYADGRTGLYLAPEHRPALQALLDGLAEEDRQRLLGLLEKTVLAPALEGLILGRWPSRGFLWEVRAVFRIPELRGHLPAVPVPALLEKVRGTREILQDRSPGSPLRALLDSIARVERDAPRTPSGDQVQPDEYVVRCRSDPQTLTLARELAQAFQDASTALFQALRGASSFYLPRTPGGTQGEGEELNAIDCADIADHSSFLCYVAAEILEQAPPPRASGKDDEITGRAVTYAVRSVIEALQLMFFQRRFPAMVAPADAAIEGTRLQSAQERERVGQQVNRKVPLLLQTRSLLGSFREAARSRPAAFLNGEVDRAGKLVPKVLAALEESVRKWTNLRVLADSVEPPRCVAPLAMPSWIFLHPLPDLSLLQCLETTVQWQGSSVPGFRIGATYCKRQPGVVLLHSNGWRYPGGSVGADISLHVPSRGACLSDTCIPVNQFLHPEDPASLVAAFLARQASRDVRAIGGMLENCNVAQQVREAAADVPRLDFLHVRRAVRGRVCFWRKRIEQCVYLVMRHPDAARLGILPRVRSLPAKEQTLLRKHFGFCPEHPVALRIEIDDRDDDGGEEPSPPPFPAPEEQPEQGYESKSDKVGVGR